MKRALRKASIAFIFSLLASTPIFAQQNGTLQFHWEKGQTLLYRVEHQTTVTDMVNGSSTMASSKLNLVKRWYVADVDSRNVATLVLILESLRQEQKRGNGETLLFDSTNLAGSTPELREQLAPHLGKAVAKVRVDGMGRVLEVLQGVANRYESEPPFVVALPASAPRQGLAWQRSYNVTLDPPIGAGEKYPVKQTCQIVGLEGGKATISLTTQFAALPQSPADQVPLLQKHPEGQVVFDLQAGRLVSARLHIDKTIEKHQGEGSSYRFQSQYLEELVGQGVMRP